jgi:hypothetical protein
LLGTLNAGSVPKNSRPMNVAVPVANADLREHQFGCEQDAADRRVERRRDAGPGAGRDQRDALARLHPDELSERGAQR